MSNCCFKSPEMYFKLDLIFFEKYFFFSRKTDMRTNKKSDEKIWNKGGQKLNLF